LKACVGLQRYTAAHDIYLQHGGGNMAYCTQNDVTVSRV